MVSQHILVTIFASHATCYLLFLCVDGEESQHATVKESEYWSILESLISCSHTGDRYTDHMCVHIYMYMSSTNLLLFLLSDLLKN